MSMNNHSSIKFLRRFVRNRRGTAEVIGSVLFIIILMFAFSNIYLWHDNAVKSMNTLLSDKLNSQIDVYWKMENEQETDILIVRNIGGVGCTLSRLWINHEHFELSNLNIGPGKSIEIDVSEQTSHIKNDGDTFTVLTTLGNMASPRGQIIIVDSGDGGNGGTEAIGPLIIADYDTFRCTVYSSSGTQNTDGYHIKIPKKVVQDTKSEIQFEVTLINNDVDGRTITLDSGSQMFFLGSKNDGGNIVSYIKIPITQPVSLTDGASGTVRFRTNLSNFGFGAGDVGSSFTYALNLVLLGSIGGSSFGQNIPFVSINIEIIN